VIEGTPVQAALPEKQALEGLIPKELPDITSQEIAATQQLDSTASQRVHFSLERRICDPQTGICTPCSSGTGCGLKFLVDGNQFSLNKRTLKLRTGGKWTAAEWKVSGAGAPHPFHIHVNPFQAQRVEPDEAGIMRPQWLWKDTLFVLDGNLAPLRMRYTEFKGAFVLHCHILDHEDRGMMELVEIID
jgi:hypothetical protein